MRRLIVVAVLAVALATVAAFFVPTVLAVRESQLRGEVMDLQRDAFVVAANASIDGPDERLIEAVKSSTHSIGLYDRDGTLISGVGPLEADRFVQTGMGGDLAEGYDGDDVVAAVPFRSGSSGYFVLRLQTPKGQGRGLLIRSYVTLLAASVGLIALAAAIGLILSHRLEQPLVALRNWVVNDSDRGFAAPRSGIAAYDQLGSALLDDRDRLQGQLKRERSFASQVSHQLRTPVAAMRVALETELSVPRADPRWVMAESLDQLTSLESTISSLLALAHGDQRQVSRCNLLELAEDGAQHWQQAVSEKGRSIEVIGESSLVSVDPGSITQILDVLVENALTHGEGTISLKVTATAQTAKLDVRDSGGTHLGRDPFASRASDTGHGIGLRLARSLAESAAGSLTLLPDSGATFRLQLPLAEGPAQSVGEAE